MSLPNQPGRRPRRHAWPRIGGLVVVVVALCGSIAASTFVLQLATARAPLAPSLGPGMTSAIAGAAPRTTMAGVPDGESEAPIPTAAASDTSPTGAPGTQRESPRPSHGPTTTARPEVTAPPGPGEKTITVTSIESLLRTLADDSVDTIVVANGTYRVSPSNTERSNALWIGKAFAGRTRPIVVRAETRGGVTFDGGGGSDFGGLSFEAGAHDQTWDGFTFANMTANESGIIEFGGYVPRASPYNITLKSITILRSCHGRATTASAPSLDHAVYISNAAGRGPHHLRFLDISVDGRGGLASAFQFDHGDSVNPNATDVVVRRLHVVGTQQAILLWTPRVTDITFDTVDIRGALSHAIRYESIGGSGIFFANVTSTGTGNVPFFSTQGDAPDGVAFSHDSLN